MALHEMPSQTGMWLEWTLEIHAITWLQPSQIGTSESFIHDANCEPVGFEGSDSETRAVDGDAVAEMCILQHGDCLDGQALIWAVEVDREHDADLFDNAGEHGFRVVLGTGN